MGKLREIEGGVDEESGYHIAGGGTCRERHSGAGDREASVAEVAEGAEPCRCGGGAESVGVWALN